MEDKLRILKMLEDGKINSEEAAKLLAALGDNTEAKQEAKKEIKPAVLETDLHEFFNIPSNEGKAKMLYIRVLSGDGDNVKVTLPIEVIKLMTTIGSANIAELEKYNINFDLIMEAIEKDIKGPIVQVDTEDGTKVLIEIA